MTELTIVKKWKNRGPWDSEPESHTFSHSGLQCDMQRNFSGAWCGYVLIPKSHQLHGCGYSDPVPEKLVFIWNRKKKEPVNLETDLGVMSVALADYVNPSIDLILHAHGGLTYASAHKDGRWIFGFDCAHAWDLPPDYDEKWRSSDQVYRDFEYVKASCRKLANQLSEISRM